MFRIIYSSLAITPFSDQQLVELLRKSFRNNLAAEITGMLLYREGNFMQTLEGPETSVKELIEKIKNDPRHHHFNILMEANILERSFGRWSMGFKKITGKPAINEPGYFDSDDLSFMSNPFLSTPPASLGVFRSFRDQI